MPRWSTTRYMSPTSMSQYFNLIMIVISTVAFFLAVFRILKREEVHGENQETMMIGMVIAIAVMALIVVATLVHRWSRHQMDAEITSIV